MVLNVSTRKYHRAVRLPEGDLAKARGDGTSKSAVSRRFVALRNLSTTLRHRRFLFTDSFLLLWKWRVG